MGHKHPIYDTDIHFTIDTATREINCANKSDLILIQGDHNSQRISIDVPRYIDGHDTSLCNRVRLHYLNIDQMTKEQSADIAQLDDIQICPDDEDVVVCTWLISKNATKYVGLLSFALRFECVVNDIVEYSWGTKLRRGITISDSIDNSDVVFEEYEDILESWYQNTVANIKQHGQEVLDSIPESYTELTQHIANLEQEIECTNENLESHIDLAFERYVEHEEDINNLDVKLSDRITRNDKRITNLEKGLPEEQFYEDSTLAYTKSVPSNALPYAEVTEIGGMTRKCTNLFDVAKISTDTWIKTGKGEATADSRFLASDFIAVTPNGTYYGSLMQHCAYYDVNKNYISDIGDKSATISRTITVPQNAYYIRFDFLKEITDGTNIMLNSGTEPLPYEPYFEGLRSAEVTEVESVGVNLLDLEVLDNLKVHGVTFKKNSDGTYTANGTATDRIQVSLCFAKIDNSQTAVLSGGSANVKITVNGFLNDVFVKNLVSVTNSTERLQQNVSYDKVEVLLVVTDGTTLSNETFFGMLNKGSTALPYKPYVRNTLPIPEEVRVKNGINDKVYDRIRYKEDGSREREIRCGEIDLGTRNWYGSSSGHFYSIIGSLPKYSSSAFKKPPLVCGKYSIITPEQWYNGKAIGISHAANGYGSQQNVLVYDPSYSDVATFKAAMSGVKLIYELAEPIITDISDILPADNYIGVERGGTVTMVNEFGYDVPSAVVYQIDTESEVVTE